MKIKHYLIWIEKPSIKNNQMLYISQILFDRDLRQRHFLSLSQVSIYTAEFLFNQGTTWRELDTSSPIYFGKFQYISIFLNIFQSNLFQSRHNLERIGYIDVIIVTNIFQYISIYFNKIDFNQGTTWRELDSLMSSTSPIYFGIF